MRVGKLKIGRRLNLLAFPRRQCQAQMDREEERDGGREIPGDRRDWKSDNGGGGGGGGDHVGTSAGRLL